MTAVAGSESYRRRFVECDNELFGDIELCKGEHEHFTVKSLSGLLAASDFRLIDVDGAGYFGRVLVLLRPLAVTVRSRDLLTRFSDRDASRHEATHLLRYSGGITDEVVPPVY